MTIFSTPKAPGSAVAKKQQMDYSSLTAPSPFPSISKSLFHCLSGIDEEDSESGSPCILIDADDMGEKQAKGLRKHVKSPTSRSQRRTTDSSLPVCSLQALSRSSKKILPRMSFSSPNIMRGKSNKRPQTEKVKKIRSNNNLSNVKLDMLNVLLERKNEEVTNLKSSLHQSEQKVALLKSKLISLEEELKQQQQHQLETPPILEMSFGSNSEYNTDHDSQTLPYVSDEMLEDLTNQLQQKNREVDVLEDEIDQWREQANEWKNKYQALVEQMQNSTVSDDESTDTNDLITFCNDYEDDNLKVRGAGKDADSDDISYSIENDEYPTLKVKENDGMTYIDVNNTSSSSDGLQSPLHHSPTDSDDNVNNESDQVGSDASRHLRNRAPLGESLLQNVQTTPISNTKRRSRRRLKTSTPAANTNRVKEVNETDTLEENVEFGAVGYKFKKYFGSRYGTYEGQVQEILPDGTRLCFYPADPNGDEYLTLEELSKTKPLKLHRDKVKSSKNDKGVLNELNLDEGNDGTTDGVLQVKKNVTCHICKNRRDLCVTFHCGKHSYCNNHCEKRLGFSATDIDPTKPPVIDYCPVCTLTCECSACLRKLSAQQKMRCVRVGE